MGQPRIQGKAENFPAQLHRLWKILSPIPKTLGGGLLVNRGGIVHQRLNPFLAKESLKIIPSIGQDNVCLIHMVLPRALRGNGYKGLEKLVVPVSQSPSLLSPAVQLPKMNTKKCGLHLIQPTIEAPKLTMIPAFQTVVLRQGELVQKFAPVGG